MSRAEFVEHLTHIPFKQLVEFIYWDNHGGDCMDIQPDDFTMAMVLEILADDDWQEFSDDYSRFLAEVSA